MDLQEVAKSKLMWWHGWMDNVDGSWHILFLVLARETLSGFPEQLHHNDVNVYYSWFKKKKTKYRRKKSIK